jgi:hypothetical protein
MGDKGNDVPPIPGFDADAFTLLGTVGGCWVYDLGGAA